MFEKKNANITFYAQTTKQVTLKYALFSSF
mgnify:CR=1 FL=1